MKITLIHLLEIRSFYYSFIELILIILLFPDSEEELDDLKAAYTSSKGDMNFILENVLCASIDDEERYDFTYNQNLVFSIALCISCKKS